MRAVVINLDEDTDRLAWMKGQLDRLGIAFERLPAKRGDTLGHLSALFGPRESSRLTNGELGCYASHLSVLEQIERDRTPATLVMEDDLELGDSLRDVLAAVGRLPAGWHIIRLSGTVKSATIPAGDISDRARLVRYSRVQLGAGAYLISYEGARRFLKWVRNRELPLDLPVDRDFRRVWVCGLDTYGVAPAPTEQDVLQRSSIDARGGRGVRKHRGLAGRLRLHGWGYLAEPFARGLYNIRQLGLGRWLGAAGVNLAAKVSKKVKRQIVAESAFVRQAAARSSTETAEAA